MSAKTPTAERAQEEDVTLPPPTYQEVITTTSSDHDFHQALGQDATAMTALTLAEPQMIALPASPSPTDHERTITSPPPTHQPMHPNTSKANDPTNTTNLTVTPLPHLTETPALIDCPYCNHRNITLVMKEGTSAQCMSAALCCLCCGVITVCIPFLCHWFEDTHIHCSGCRKEVATIPHDGTIQVLWPGPPTAGQIQGRTPARNTGPPPPGAAAAMKGQ